MNTRVQGTQILLDGDEAKAICSALTVSDHPQASGLIDSLQDYLGQLRGSMIGYQLQVNGRDDYSLIELLYETGVLKNKGDMSRWDNDLPLIRSWSTTDRHDVERYAASIKAVALGSLHRFTFEPNERPSILKGRN